MSEENCRVGIVALIFDEEKVLMEKRTNQVEEKNYWGFIAGGKKAGESLVEAAEREVREETGASFQAEEIFGIVDHSGLRDDSTSWTVAGFSGTVEGKIENMEPGKRQKLEWFDFNSLPEPLHPTSELILEVFDSEKMHPELES